MGEWPTVVRSQALNVNFGFKAQAFFFVFSSICHLPVFSPLIAQGSMFRETNYAPPLLLPTTPYSPRQYKGPGSFSMRDNRAMRSSSQTEDFT